MLVTVADAVTRHHRAGPASRAALTAALALPRQTRPEPAPETPAAMRSMAEGA